MPSIIRRTHRPRRGRQQRAVKSFTRMPGMHPTARGQCRVWMHYGGRVRILQLLEADGREGAWVVESLRHGEWTALGNPFGAAARSLAFRAGNREARHV